MTDVRTAAELFAVDDPYGEWGDAVGLGQDRPYPRVRGVQHPALVVHLNVMVVVDPRRARMRRPPARILAGRCALSRLALASDR